MRNSNIELLRIISIIGVIILHFNTIGGGISSVPQYSFKWICLIVLECVFISSVNIFILITGYYMANSYIVKCSKLIKLLFQVLIFNVGIYSATVLLGIEKFSLKGVMLSFLPQNYFIVLYCVMYVFIPYINCLIEQMTKKSFDNLIKMIFIIFSVCSFGADFIAVLVNENVIGINTISAYGSQYGYTIVHFFVMYLMGAYLRKYELHNIKISKKIFTIIICWLSLILMSYIFNVYKLDTGVLYSYCNPIIILCAVNIFIIFISFKQKNNKIINVLSKGTFTVFIIHGSILVLLKNYSNTLANKHAIYFVFYLVSLCVVIYLIGWLIYWIYDKVEKKIFNRIFNVIENYEIGCKKES